jgi:hypothetical protein
MIYPSSANPNRYVVVVASTSTAGMHFWRPGGLWNFPGGYPTLAMDWTIQDGRLVALEPGLGQSRVWVASGVFDPHWRRDDRWVFRGDPELRAKGRLRHAPPPDFQVPANVLDSYVGQYEIEPGQVLFITREGNHLLGKVATTSLLTAESNNDFVADEFGGVVTFQHDAQGAVTGLEFNSANSALEDVVARKIGSAPP